MSLKDWKKIGKHFESKDGNKVLVLIENRKTKPKTYYYELAIRSKDDRFRFTNKKLRSAKTKAQALKFAKEYMKKH